MSKQPTAAANCNPELCGELTTRLSRIEGQVRGVSKMIAEGRPCIDVLQQLASIQAAMRGVNKTVLKAYLECCAGDIVRSEQHEELLDALFKFAK